MIEKRPSTLHLRFKHVMNSIARVHFLKGHDLATQVREAREHGFERVIPRNTTTSPLTTVVRTRVKKSDIIPSCDSGALPSKYGFDSAIPTTADSEHDSHATLDPIADAIFITPFTSQRPRSISRSNTNDNSCLTPRLETRAPTTAAAQTSREPIPGDYPASPHATPNAPPPKADAGSDISPSYVAQGATYADLEASVRAALGIVPPVRLADVSALAAAFRQTDLPPSLEALARPTLDGVIDVRAVERDAARLSYPDADDALLDALVGLLAPATYRIYGRSVTRFTRYAARVEKPALPPDAQTLAKWIIAAGESQTTYRQICRDLYNVSAVCDMVGLTAPIRDRLVTGALKFVAHKYGRAAEFQKLPFGANELRRALTYLDRIAKQTPERAALILALISLGIATALRREELCSLDTDDIELSSRGLRIRVRKTKTRAETDPPAYIDVDRITDKRICPVLAIQRYVEICRITHGPLFRGTLPDGSLRNGRLSAESVNNFVKELVDGASMGDPAAYGAHSLRAGMMTDAFQNGVSLDDAMDVSLHRDKNEAKKYIRPRPFARTITKRVFD